MTRLYSRQEAAQDAPEEAAPAERDETIGRLWPAAGHGTSERGEDLP